MKTSPATVGAVLFVVMSAWAQDAPPTEVKIGNEPHHALSFENDQVRVFHVKLEPNEATLPHRHESTYAYLSLRPITISHEVRGRQPVLTELEAGEFHTSKGGFTVAERNNSLEQADLIVVEPRKTESPGFVTPMGGIHYHNGGYADLFEAQAMRGYSLKFFPGGKTDLYTESYDRLILALTDLRLRDTFADGTQSVLEMKAGETVWMPRGRTHSIENLVDSIVTMDILEFN